METLEIESCIRQWPHVAKQFGGVLAANHFLVHWPPSPTYYVVNTDTSNSGGSHWVVFRIGGSEYPEFFDSLGGFPGDYQSHFNVVLAARATPYKQLVQGVQNPAAPTCGLYALLYLYLRCHDFSMDEIALFCEGRDTAWIVSKILNLIR